jgi:hypothetical protein
VRQVIVQRCIHIISKFSHQNTQISKHMLNVLKLLALVAAFVLASTQAFSQQPTQLTQPAQPNRLQLGLGALTFDGAEPNLTFSGAYTRSLTPAFDVRAGLHYYASANVTDLAKTSPLFNPPLSLSGSANTVFGTFSRTLLFAEASAGWRPFQDGLRVSLGVAVRRLTQVHVSEIYNAITVVGSSGPNSLAVWGSQYRDAINVGFAASVEYDFVLTEQLLLTAYGKHNNYGGVANSLTWSAGILAAVAF